MGVKSRSECQHNLRLFVTGGSYISTDEITGHGRHNVTVCADCGEFHIAADRNGEHFDLRFVLPTEELVHAAEAYLRILASDELDRKHQDK